MLISIFYSCSNKNQNEVTGAKSSALETGRSSLDHKSLIDPYDFDTILTNGYHLSYKVFKDSASNDTIQSLTLVKGNTDIAELSVTEYHMLHKNLGYIGADFGETFVFVQSFGSGNPSYLRLIEKETGKEIKKGIWVDAVEKEKVLLYITSIHETDQQLKLLDLKTTKERVVNDFNDSECVKQAIGGLRDCVRIDTITKTEIVLNIDSEEKKLIKKIKR